MTLLCFWSTLTKVRQISLGWCDLTITHLSCVRNGEMQLLTSVLKILRTFFTWAATLIFSNSTFEALLYVLMASWLTHLLISLIRGPLVVHFTRALWSILLLNDGYIWSLVHFAAIFVLLSSSALVFADIPGMSCVHIICWSTPLLIPVISMLEYSVIWLH
jgi:hypothetical protein